jgi:hypothetical protein
MKIAAITGLTKESINDMTRRRIRTFELRSSHNLQAFSEIGPGDKVFVTDVALPDLVSGLCGYIALVKGVDIRMHRITYTIQANIEERETLTGRIQLILHSSGKVREVYPVEAYKPVYVDAIEVTMCEAR